jgi:signal recognition particle GTPase
MKYIGQTGCTFKARCKEHIEAIRTNRHNSKFAQHMLGTGHAYNLIDQTVEILHTEKKEQKLNTLKRFQVYNLTKKALQLNDTHTERHNPIFDILIKICPHT